MAKLKIYTFPDSVLKQPARPIERVEKSLFTLADDMLETMYDAPGIGLAANQVGILDRIIVLDTEYNYRELEDGELPPKGAEIVGDGVITGQNSIVMINPEISYREGKLFFCEGCLSVPEYTADVERSEKIKVDYQTIDGVKKTLSADGLLAVAIQHEIDHLKGRLYIERLDDLKRERAKKKVLKYRQELERNGGKSPKRKKEKGF